MKSLVVILTLILSIGVGRATDTTYIDAPEMAGLLTYYIAEAYRLDMTPYEAQLHREHPEIKDLIDKWMSTKEGHMLSNTDVNWERKMRSFVTMYPFLASQRQIIAPLLRWHVLQNIQLFYYANEASIVLLNGSFHGVLFDPGSKTPWNRTISDPVFKRLYESGKDDKGVFWYTRVQMAMKKKVNNRS